MFSLRRKKHTKHGGLGRKTAMGNRVHLLAAHISDLSSYHSFKRDPEQNNDDRQSDRLSEIDEVEFFNALLNQREIRVQMLILDYKQFKAARVIQRYLRGWLVRKRIQKMDNAARVIQRAWHRYAAKRHIIVLAESALQYALNYLYYTASMKIQAFFRGWWSRKHINNMNFLKNMQRHCVEEILLAYAADLHTLMRTGHLPGYMSFSTDADTSRIRDLLTSMTYRFYNRFVCNKYMMNRAAMARHTLDFFDATYYTQVPYPGFNDYGRCNWRGRYEAAAKIYELREYDVAQAFLRNDVNAFETRKLPVRREKDKGHKPHQLGDKERRFCKDLVNSMKFWRVCPPCRRMAEDATMEEGFNYYITSAKQFLEHIDFIRNCDCHRDLANADYLNCDQDFK